MAGRKADARAHAAELHGLLQQVIALQDTVGRDISAIRAAHLKIQSEAASK